MKNLKATRLAQGLTQAGLAKLSGVSLSAIQKYEAGARQPTAASAYKLAEALGVTYKELMGG